MTIYTLTALLPLVILFVLMIPARQPAYIAAPITLIITYFLAWQVWQVPADWLNLALGRGVMVTIEILLIVAGALLLLSVLQAVNVFTPLIAAIEYLTADRRIQAILIGWLFVGFIEGAAGFGTPAILAAPLLVFIGFKPIVAVIIALIGDSAAVTFGAVGVPVTIGLAEGLGGQMDLALSAGILAAFIHLIIGLSVPLMISIATTYLTTGQIKDGLKLWPYALLAGVGFLIPYYLTAQLIGPELPSVIGGLVGLSLIILLTYFKVLVPDQVWRWPENKTQLNHSLNWTGRQWFLFLSRSLIPYALIVVLLLVTRLDVAGLGSWLQAQTIGGNWAWILDYQLAPLYSPGIIFVLVAGLAIIWHQLSLKQLGLVAVATGRKLLWPSLGLIAILGIVQIFIYSDNNLLALPAMPVYLAGQLAYLGWWWPVVSPIIGLLGSFIAGSATVSNLLLTSLQAETAAALGWSVELIVALQAVGSAVGNMIAIHNILAALTVVGLVTGEGRVIKATIGPALIYALLAGLLGLGLAVVL